MTYKNILFLILFMLLCGSIAFAASNGKAIVHSSWAVNSKSPINIANINKTAVAHFLCLFSDAANMRKVDADTSEIDTNNIRWDFCNENIQEGALGTIGAFKWIDLNMDGYYELIATLDFSGRAFYNSLYIIRNEGSKFKAQIIKVFNIESLDGTLLEIENSDRGSLAICDGGCKIIINDLDNDGIQELILPINLSTYRGAKPVPVWSAVFQWSEKHYEDKSRYFMDFYTSIMKPCLDRRIQKLNEIHDAMKNKSTSRGKALSTDEKEYLQQLEEELSAQQIIKDKILRLSGTNKLAGFEVAKDWANNSNATLRSNAIIVLQEISNDEAETILNTLAKDPDRSVAREAASALRALSKHVN